MKAAFRFRDGLLSDGLPSECHAFARHIAGKQGKTEKQYKKRSSDLHTAHDKKSGIFRRHYKTARDFPGQRGSDHPKPHDHRAAGERDRGNLDGFDRKKEVRIMDPVAQQPSREVFCGNGNKREPDQFWTHDDESSEHRNRTRGGEIEISRNERLAHIALDQPPDQTFAPDRHRRDRSDSNRCAEPHDEGRDNSRPEQPLGEREHENEDRTGTGPQTDRYDGRKPALPSPGARELGRLRPVRVTGMIVVVMVVVVMMTVIMMMRVIVRVRVAVMGIRRPPPFRDECTALHPQKPRTERRDQRIAHDLDNPYGVSHDPRGGAEQRRGDADEDDCDQRLEQR